MVNSGSSANLVLVAATKKHLNWNDGDEIITSVVGFPTTVAPIVQNNLVPVFIDIEIDSLNFDLDLIEQNITTGGDLAVNGATSADITTTTGAASVFNANATTLLIGGASTTLTLGASTGTATINNLVFALPNATNINAAGAILTVSSGVFGDGYGSTGTTIGSNGNIQSNGTLTIDGISTLTGDVTTAGNIAVNGGSVTTTATTGNLFNATVTTLNIGGAATAVTLGATTTTTAMFHHYFMKNH
jgi:hypothetical protein